MGTHCLTEVTSKNIMKFWPLQLSSCLVFVPCWPCLIQCPIHTHMPCLMNPGMVLHLPMVEPSVESRFKHTVDHPNLEMAMTLSLHGVSMYLNQRTTSVSLGIIKGENWTYAYVT